MKKNIHPKYYTNVQVVCSCGNTFEVGGATVESMNTDFCFKCHPAYTGERKVADTASKIKQFEERQKKSVERQKDVQKIAEQRKERESKIKKDSQAGALTLKDMLKNMQKES